MKGNIGGEDINGNMGSLSDHMAAFDALPEAVRIKLKGMSINWNGQDVMNVYYGHGEATTLIALRKTESDMQARYRKRIGL